MRHVAGTAPETTTTKGTNDMALIEKRLAEKIVELRQAADLGHEYCRADETADLLEESLLEHQRQRGVISRMGELVEAATT